MTSVNSSESDYDVAVVGLGPVGCLGALLFAEAGLKVVAFERDAEVYKLPRAVNLDGEIIRALQKVGRGQAVQDLMQAVRPGDRAGFANARREWLFGQDFRTFGSNGWQPMNMFDQPELESYLRTQVLAHPGVTSCIGAEVTGLTNPADQVDLISRPVNGGASESFGARFAVACDGAASPTRKALNIGWQDLGYDHHWLVVDVTLRAGHTLNNDTVQVCDPDRLATYVCTKDPYRRWEFKLLPGETPDDMLDDEMIASLIDPWTPRGTYEIRRAAVYQFHAATAERWCVGRVFLAGDAAHQTPPFLGQGMNAGMRDVVNLAWKLPMVISGVASDRLLDTYAAERTAHAADMVDWAVSIGQLMEHLAEQARCARDGLPGPATPSGLQSSGYGQGREQRPIRNGVVMLEQVSESGATGYLFSQPIVRRPAGDEIRLDDLLGSGFALVLRTGVEPALSDRSRKILQQIGARVVGLDALEAVHGRFDRVFEQHTAAVVRPDRLVFGHTTSSLTLDDLIGTLAGKLALNNDRRE